MDTPFSVSINTKYLLVQQSHNIGVDLIGSEIVHSSYGTFNFRKGRKPTEVLHTCIAFNQIHLLGSCPMLAYSNLLIPTENLTFVIVNNSL
jgi:hypothetical protein